MSEAVVRAPGSCPSTEQMSALLADELPASPRTIIEEHLDTCDQCQSALLDLAGTLDLTPLGDRSAETDHGLGPTATMHGSDEPRAGFLQGIPNPSGDSRSASSSAEMLLLPATNLDLPGLELIDELGRGGLGVVYLAWQQSLCRLVAVKVVAKEWLTTPVERERALRGAAAVVRFQHPNIVQVYHLGQHQNWLYGILEYLEGGSLADRLNGTPWDAPPAAALLRTLASAVAFVHENGFVHRDVKPANVLFKADGTPKLADFGLARSVSNDSRLTLEGQALGTPRYMAPEQATGRQKIGPAVDIYALGSVLYELLTGRSPFHGETKFDTLYQVVHQPVVPPTRIQPSIPLELERICLRCLEKEPGRRYPSAASLADDLDRFLLAGKVQPLSSKALQRGRAALASHPWLAALGGLLLTATLLEAVVILALWNDSRDQAAGQFRQFSQSQSETAAELNLTKRQVTELVMALAEKELKVGNQAQARRWLNMTPPELRDEAWRELMKQSEDEPKSLRP